MNRDEIIRSHFNHLTDEKWNELKGCYPFSEIPSIVDHVMDELKIKFEKTDWDTTEVEDVLLEAVWVSRWTENKQALYAVLQPEEAMQSVKDIFIELDKIGYEIKKKV